MDSPLSAMILLREMLTHLDVMFYNIKLDRLAIKLPEYHQNLSSELNKLCTNNGQQQQPTSTYSVSLNENFDNNFFNRSILRQHNTLEITATFLGLVTEYCIVEQYDDEESYSRVHGSSIHLMVSTVEYQYLLTKEGSKFRGAYMDMLDIMASYLNFTYTVMEPATPGWGNINPDQSWTGKRSICIV